MNQNPQLDDNIFKRLDEAENHGQQPEFSQAEARLLGSFTEDALSESEALTSTEHKLVSE